MTSGQGTRFYMLQLRPSRAKYSTLKKKNSIFQTTLNIAPSVTPEVCALFERNRCDRREGRGVVWLVLILSLLSQRRADGLKTSERNRSILTMGVHPGSPGEASGKKGMKMDPLHHTIHNNHLKMGQRPKCKS